MCSAQGFYFDIGGGAGMTASDYFYDGENTYPEYSRDTRYVSIPRDFGFDASVKVGFGPLDIPLFFVGEAAWIRSNTFNDYQEYRDSVTHVIHQYMDTTDVNHIFLGPGLVFYPHDNFQIATSFGVVNTNFSLTHKEQLPEDYTLKYSKNGLGYGFNISGAMDLGDFKYTSGLLIGGKFSYSSAKDLEITDTFTSGGVDYTYSDKYSPTTTYIGLFIKYRSRN